MENFHWNASDSKWIVKSEIIPRKLFSWLKTQGKKKKKVEGIFKIVKAFYFYIC